jgi:AcrR family transcriptional regulator
MAEAYKSPRRATGRRDIAAPPGTPAAARELRAQGRKTMRKLLDAGMRVFAERGFHAARVDDIVRAARTSHGTFYLYFANKEELLRALAIQCAQEMGALAGGLGAVTIDEEGAAELRRFLETFFSTYARFGPVLRAWMEGNIEDRETSRLGVVAFTDIAAALGERMREAGERGDAASVAALMALLERFAYFLVSRNLEFDADTLFDTVTRIVHRGFFGAALAA